VIIDGWVSAVILAVVGVLTASFLRTEGAFLKNAT